MIENNIEKKLVTNEHRKTYRKHKREYQQLVSFLNGSSITISKEMAALSRAAIVVQHTHNLIPYDVQLLSAIALMKGGILEIGTGEGKTLIAAMAACALSLLGRRVHIYTPNDYLSKRDSDFTKKMASELGITCDYVTDEMSHGDKRRIFHDCSIVYATERVVIFSYINDCTSASCDMDMLPRGLDCLIVDEADSILIDNGETPYIITERKKEIDERLAFMMPFARMMSVRLMPFGEFENFSRNPSDLHAIGNSHTKEIMLLEKGYEDLENYLIAKGIMSEKKDAYKKACVDFVDALKKCLMALHTYKEGVNYIVKNNKVIVVDQHTGRMLPQVRINLGIHQAIEVKEGVDVQPDNYTKGKMTLENFISRYSAISGMTGTAIEAKEEIRHFYGMQVYCVPGNKPSARIDHPDTYCASKEVKYKKIIRDIKKRTENNQPVLVGSSSIEEAEKISELLGTEGIAHVLLTPKFEEEEASIIAQAGRPGRVTVTTNMAGRGTDIALGVSAEYLIQDSHSEEERQAVHEMSENLRNMALQSGGLHVIGTERSRSSRVDRQLMGRAGRQGDPGSTQFYMSPDDEIFRAMGESKARLKKLFSVADKDIIQKSIQYNIRSTQRNIKFHSMEQKRLQRKSYGVHEQQMHHYMQFRDEVKYGKDDDFLGWIEGVVFRGVQQLVLNYVDHESFDTDAILRGEEDLYYFARYVMYLDVEESDIMTGKHENTAACIYSKLMDGLHYYLESFGRKYLSSLMRETILFSCDEAWMENMGRVEEIQKGIHLRSYAGEKPDIKYQEEAFMSYKIMIVDILISVTSRVASLLSMLDERNGADTYDKESMIA